MKKKKKTKKKKKHLALSWLEEEDESCSPNWVISDPILKKKKKNQTQDFRIFHLEFAGGC
jgi:hypothetical protein